MTKNLHQQSFKSTCSYCGVGCGVQVSVDKRGQIELEGDASYPVNKGKLCSKGMNLHYTVMDRSDRQVHPEMRWSKRHAMQQVSWETAMKRSAAVFKSLIKQYGPDSVGFYVSGQCLTEEYYLINKLTKGFIGTNNIDTNSRLCMSSAVVGYAQALGEDSVPASYEDIDEADCFFIAGANPAWCHPILFRRLEERKADHLDTKIIVVDPRATQTCAQADLHLQLRPGTDTVLYQAIGRALIAQGSIDIDFIQQHTNGFDDYRNTVMQRSIAEAAQICDVPQEDIELAATYIGESQGFMTLWAMGLNQSTDGVNRNNALINLNLITGHIGKVGSGPLSLTGQPNAMGGREVGGMASLLAAHRNLANPEHREEVAQFWGVEELPARPGLTATQMFEALKSGKMKAIWIICTNPSVSLPNAKLVDEALEAAKFVIVQDVSKRSDTAKYADLLLPAAGWLEKEGTMTNSERRISHLEKAVDAPGEALPDIEILIRFAKAMGYHGFDYKNASEVYAEHCALTKGTNIDISGLSYERLKKERSIQWPVPSGGHPGTKRLFTDHRFYTPDRKANIKSGGAETPAESLSPEFPLILTTGRVRDQWHTMTRTGKVNRLNKHIPQAYLEIHPLDAVERGIKEGMPITVENERGQVRVNAKISDSIKRGVVFLPMHWGKVLGRDFSRANNLTDSNYDPQSKQPGFKYSAVEVRPHTKPKQKIVIIGAGAAAYRFINTYRTLNSEDELHVFSKEEYPFYNRVLLPEYVNDNLQWEDLLKFKYGEFEKLNVFLHVDNCIDAVDKEKKTVTDSRKQVHDYDLLVMATGSRAFVPDSAPIHLPGIFTMRDRNNADELKSYLHNGGHVLIVGGGLLGLELASSLRELDIEVTIVQLSSRLMERQLDSMASGLLRSCIEAMGIHVYTNDEVQQLKLRKGSEGKTVHAQLKSGKHLSCNAVVYAIGTRPNIELAKSADLSCGRGVKVNDYLQTSDEHIFAMGEIAEYQQKLNGITAAAEQQADTMARYIAGDLGSRYAGSTPMNILKFPNLELCSIGIPDIPVDEEGYDEILFIDKSKNYYKKCIIYQDRLVGAILMGDKSEFAEFKELIDNKIELSEKRMELLRSGQKSEPVIGKLICSCNNVGSGNLEQAIEKGCHSLNELCKATGAGLGCGSCKSEVQHLLNSHQLIASAQ